MTRLIKAAILLLGPLLLLAPTAYATPPVPISGSTVIDYTVISTRSADGNTIFRLASSFTISGDIRGSCFGEETDIIHPNGQLTFHGSCRFTGSVLASSLGTAVLRYSGTEIDPTAPTQGSFAIGHGTGGLDELHVHGTFQAVATGPLSFVNTYSGTAHFEH